MSDLSQPSCSPAVVAARSSSLAMRLVACRRATVEEAAFGLDVFFALAAQLLTTAADASVEAFRAATVTGGPVTRQSIELGHSAAYGVDESPFSFGTDGENLVISFCRRVERPSQTLYASVQLITTPDANLTVLVDGDAAALARIAELGGEAGRLLTIAKWPILRFNPVVGGKRNEVTFESVFTDFAGAFQYAYDEAVFTASKRRHG